MAEHRSLLLTEGEDYWWEDDYQIGLDQGYYQYGISRSYTALTEDQYSGTTSISVAGNAESHTNNCVKDERTGLMWNKAPSSAVGLRRMVNSIGTIMSCSLSTTARARTSTSARR